MTPSATARRCTLVYDNAGLIKGYRHTRQGAAQPALDQSFTYDEVGALTSMTRQATSYSYSYDRAGNRLTKTIGGTSYASTIAATSNRLLSTQESGPVLRTFSTDAAGRVTHDGVCSYTYNDRGRMASAIIGANTVSYFYNGLEQRVRKSGPTAAVPTGNVYYAYDEAGHLIGEYDANLVPIYETVYLGDTPVAVIKQVRSGSGKNVTVTTQLSYVYADHIDTPRVVVRASDHAMQWRWDDAEAFGATPPNENPSGLGVFRFNQRFPGQVFDAETGNFYNGNRDYRNWDGRYLQVDPIGLEAGMNPFAYVGANPVSYVDPTGLQVFVCNRAVNGFPFTGNHSYLWDATSGNAEGMRGSTGSGMASKEKGPIGSDGDACNKVQDSEGKERAVMDYMKKYGNWGTWLPVVNDCHSAVARALDANGLQNPGAPGGRLGPLPGAPISAPPSLPSLPSLPPMP